MDKWKKIMWKLQEEAGCRLKVKAEDSIAHLSFHQRVCYFYVIIDIFFYNAWRKKLQFEFCKSISVKRFLSLNH